MRRSWHGRAAFLADRSAAPSSRPSGRQSIAIISVLVLAAAGAAAVSWLVTPSRAQAFDLVHGSIYINDSTAPVSVDLASGKATVRLLLANEQVGADNAGDLSVQPLSTGTLLLNTSTGEFNMVDATGFVIKLDGGVPLPAHSGTSGAQGVPSGDSAFIVRSATSGTDVYLVNQATVQAAAQRNAHVDPRAFRNVPDQLASGGASLAAANGSLWMITGAAAAGERLWHLTLPNGSKNGVALRVASLRTITGRTALGVATLHSDGSGGDTLAMATASHIDLVLPDGTTRTVRYAPISGLDTLVPATNQQGRAAFLYHGSQGWGVVSVGANGSQLAVPRTLSSVVTTDRLIAPAVSRNGLYTMDTTTGALLAINSRGQVSPSDAAGYPLAEKNGKVAERSNFLDAYVIARGSRVIYDSPIHAYAVTIFTDGSSPPQLIDKNAAAIVNASGGADALAVGHIAPSGGTAPPQKRQTKPAPAQPINPTLDCAKSNQVPHIPQISTVEPGSRSVQLAWTYPRLAAQDCVPSTYVVSVRLISARAPSPPSAITVQGQTGVNLVGLFPSTQYAVTVTAYINSHGTSSDSELFQTGPEGPPAPTGVTATTTPTGDWVVSWQSCGGLRVDCVPALSWDIVPRFCDGYGLSGPPSVLNVIGDPTLHSFTATFKGGGALLGRALSFGVQGEGEQNAKGTPSKPSACARSWSPPVAADIALTASQPATTSLGGTTTTTVTANLGSNPQLAVGGLGSTITFHLTSPTGTVSQAPIVFDGSSDVITAKFTNVQAGVAYTATATVTPTGHSAAAVTVGPVDVTARSDWPRGLSVAATCPTSGVLRLGCTLSTSISGLASADARGETFDLTDKSRLICGNRAQPIVQSGFDPANTTITQGVSLILYNGACEVDVQLVENANDAQPLVFGGTPSPVLTVPITLGQPQTLDAQSGDFAANWASSTDEPSYVFVQYTDGASHSGYTDAQVAALTGTWSEQITAPDGSACGSSTAQPTHDGIHVDPKPSCVNSFGNQNGWHISVSYTNADGSDGNTFTYNLQGTPPGFTPCTVESGKFSAQWAGDSQHPAATLSFSGKDADLAGCVGWSYDLLAPDGSVCNSGPSTAPTSATPISINAKCKDTPSVDNWSIRVTYHNPDGSAASFVVQVSGNPPP